MLSVIGIIALLVFFLLASVTYGPNVTGGGTGALAMLIASLGGIIIAFTLTAAAFGTSLALLYVGATVIAAVAAAALAKVPKGD